MKLTVEKIKKMIREELSRDLNEMMDSPSPAGFENNFLVKNYNFARYLISPRFISEPDYDQPVDFKNDPANLSSHISEALQGRATPDKGLKAVYKLFPMVLNGHPNINPKSKDTLADFLDWCIREFNEM